MVKTRNRLARIYSMRCLTKLQAGACWTGSYQAVLRDTSCASKKPGWRFSSTDRRRLVICLGVSTADRSEVSIYSLVDASRCVHKGHHRYTLKLRLDGSDQTLTLVVIFLQCCDARLTLAWRRTEVSCLEVVAPTRAAENNKRSS
jgi:hypothetical protein